jgi:regulator of sigma E protease
MNLLSTAIDVLLVVLGFGAIIFVHELGHFLAARWAGIRVLAFAIGFGPALFSYRKGMGFQKGSSEAEYLARLDREAELMRARPRGDAPPAAQPIAPTEYRLNALPFGGYVKMLGQEDLNPAATSAASDSYQNCVPWKRLVVISAGVVMNVIFAAILFVVVFTAGRLVSPAVIGQIEPGRAAALAVPVAGPITTPGLRSGDIIEAINGERPLSFDDLVLASAMAARDDTLVLEVRRPGVAEPVVFEVDPQENFITAMQDIGADPSRGNQVGFDTIDGLRKGMVLTHVAGAPVESAHDLDRIVRAGEGRPLLATFRDATGATREHQVQPVPELMVGLVGDDKTLRAVQHLAGLVGVMSIASREKAVTDHAKQQGLMPGDIFARIGDLEYPGIAEGMLEVRRHKGRTVPMVVLRANAQGGYDEVSLPSVKVQRDGRVGMEVDETTDRLPLLAAALPETRDSSGKTSSCSAAALDLAPGTTISAVNGIKARNLHDVARLVRDAIAARPAEPTVQLTIQPAAAGLPAFARRADAAGPDQPPSQTISWTLAPHEVKALEQLGWTSNVPPGIFEPAQTKLRAEGVAHALAMGLHETKRTMLQTYLTFARLVQGTVKVEHLKGPVGITHLGTLIAERGFVWLLFFLALISVNLAVINFLPLPIVDGGQFLFIVYEWIRGKPVPVGFQNAVTVAGLVLIGGMFLFVTYNDIRNLLGI